MSEATRDRVAGGTIVLRDQRVVYATMGAQALLGRSGRDLLGRELSELLAPEDRERVIDRHLRRLRGEPVPTEYEMQLLRPDGSRCTTEARVSLEGTEVVVQLQDLSDQADRRRRLEGLAALGVAVQRERTESAIQELVRTGLAGLDLAPALLRPSDDGVRVVWARFPAAIGEAVTALLNRPIEGLVGPWSPFSREVWSAGSAYSDDWVTHAALFARQEKAGRIAAAAAALGLVRGLAVRLDQRLGSAGYLLAVGEWIRSDDLPAFRLFGAQVAAALDSARDIAELSARNVDLAALAELGRLSGSLSSIDEFLPRALEVVLATSGCQAAGVYTASPARQQLELTHVAGLTQRPPWVVRTGSLGSPLGAVVRSRRLVVAHLEELDGEARHWLEGVGLTTFAYVPLVARTQTLGVMVAAWRDRLDAEACRPELLLAMGSHLAAAMESNHLLGDLRRRVGELTLLNDVAAATASLDPALLLENALRRICETLEADGGMAHLVTDGVLEQQAAIGLRAETAALIRRLGLEEGPGGQAMARRQPVIDPPPELEGSRCSEARLREQLRTVLAVPLLAKERAVGSLCLFRRTARPFASGEVTLLSAIGVQLGVAVDAARQHAQVISANADLRREEGRSIRRSRLEALGELSAVIAHEVRNPLGVIFNSLGSLRRLTGSAGDARMLVDIVGEEADRLNRIVGDLLDFARHSPPQLAPDRLEQVVEEAVSVALAQPPAGLEVVRSLDAPLPEVPLDAGQVRQAVLNLVVNAVQAMPRGGRLTVRTFVEDAAAVVEVEDTGPGIPELVRARVFEPFFTTKATGTGLGLPVVKRIVEGHGGELRLRTGPTGTCFSLHFPLAPGPAPGPAAGPDPGASDR